MRSSLVFSILMISLALLMGACKKAKPEVTALSKLDGLSFSATSLSLPSWMWSNSVGNCPTDVIKIEVSFDGNVWTDLTGFDPSSTLTCANDGHFRFSVDFTRSELASYKSLMNMGQSVNMWARGYSENSLTEDTKILLSYANAATGGSHLYVGGGKSVNGAYSMAGRISYAATGVSGNLVSGTYSLQGMIRSQ